MGGGGKRKKMKLASVAPLNGPGEQDQGAGIGSGSDDETTPRIRSPRWNEAKADNSMPMANVHKHVFVPGNPERMHRKEVKKSMLANARRAGYILLFVMSTIVELCLGVSGILYFLQFVNTTCDSDAGTLMPAREFFAICGFLHLFMGLVQSLWSGGLCRKWIRYLGYIVFLCGVILRTILGFVGFIMIGVAVGASNCSTAINASIRNYTILHWLLNIMSWGYPLFIRHPRRFAEGAEEAVGFGLYIATVTIAVSTFTVGFSVIDG